MQAYRLGVKFLRRQLAVFSSLENPGPPRLNVAFSSHVGTCLPARSLAIMHSWCASCQVDPAKNFGTSACSGWLGFEPRAKWGLQGSREARGCGLRWMRFTIHGGKLGLLAPGRHLVLTPWRAERAADDARGTLPCGDCIGCRPRRCRSPCSIVAISSLVCTRS
jgi:hypothetical protein